MDKMETYFIVRYHIFCILFQIIWSIAVLGFAVFLVLHFNNYWTLLSLLLIFLRPNASLKIEKTCKDDDKPNRKSYGTNNPPQ